MYKSLQSKFRSNNIPVKPNRALLCNLGFRFSETVHFLKNLELQHKEFRKLTTVATPFLGASISYVHVIYMVLIQFINCVCLKVVLRRVGIPVNGLNVICTLHIQVRAAR
jgi:hypothetical protein